MWKRKNKNFKIGFCIYPAINQLQCFSFFPEDLSFHLPFILEACWWLFWFHFLWKKSWFSLQYAGYIFWVMKPGLTIFILFQHCSNVAPPSFGLHSFCWETNQSPYHWFLHVMCYFSGCCFQGLIFIWGFQQLTMMNKKIGHFH